MTCSCQAGNQLGALRFSRGHFLQMMDATPVQQDFAWSIVEVVWTLIRSTRVG